MAAPVVCVHNPRSRRGRSARRDLERWLAGRKHLPAARWVEIGELGSWSPAEGPVSRVVAVGGDGTVNAVAAWILGGASPTASLGIVPGGTGNNLARGLGLPARPDLAAPIAVEGALLRRIDVLRVTPTAPPAVPGPGAARWILQGGALGFPAAIAERYARLREVPLFRFLAYPLAGWIYRLLALLGLLGIEAARLRGRMPPALDVEVALPGELLRLRALAVFIGNEPTLGGGFRPCPLARLDDGLVDLCLVRAGSGEPHLKLFRRIQEGRAQELPGAVEYRQSAGPVEIRLGAPAPLLVDGDLAPPAPGHRLEVLRGALPLAVGR